MQNKQDVAKATAPKKAILFFHLDKNKRIFKIISYIPNINFYLFELCNTKPFTIPLLQKK